MKNVNMSVNGSKLLIEIDLSKEHGLSSSKKSIIIASSEGNKGIPGSDGVKIGLNVYKQA